MLEEYKNIQKNIGICCKNIDLKNDKISKLKKDNSNIIYKIEDGLKDVKYKLNSLLNFCNNEFEPLINESIAKHQTTSSIMDYANEPVEYKIDDIDDIIEETVNISKAINDCINRIINLRLYDQIPYYSQYANLKNKLIFLYNNCAELYFNNYSIDDLTNFIKNRESKDIDKINEEKCNIVNYCVDLIKEDYNSAKEKENAESERISKCQINYNISNNFNNDLFVGFLKGTSLNINNEMLKKVRSDVGVSKMMEIFNGVKEISVDSEYASVDLKELIKKQGCIYFDLQKANIDTDKKNFYDFLRKFIVQFISKQPSKMAQIAYVNQYIDNIMVGFFGELTKTIRPANTFKEVISNSLAINDLIDTIVSRINDRIKNYGISDENNDTTIFDYNAKIADNKQSLVLLVISNYKKNINSQQMEKLNSIITSGPKAGVFTLLINEEQDAEESFGSFYGNSVKDIENKFIYKFAFENNAIFFNGQHLKNVMTGENFSFKECFNNMKYGSEHIDTKIYLNTIFNHVEYVKNRPVAYDELQIPIGKEGSDIKYLNLQSDSSNCHVLITGITGSGKSVSLHTLILSSCYNYSPDEVQFYLIDFKDGVEFSHYCDNLKMPHIKYIALNSSTEDAMDILKNLDAKKAEINNQLKRLGANNIKVYNNHEDVKSGKLPKIPHTFILIDEFQVIFNSDSTTSSECVDILKVLATQGRNVGFHLVLSSQKIPSSNFNEILSQLNTRLCFKNDKMLIKDLIPKSGGREDDLEEAGRALLSQGDTECSLIRTAFVDISEQNHDKHSGNQIHNEILNKYKHFETNINLAGQTKSAMFKSYSEVLSHSSVEDKYFSIIGINQITNKKLEIEFSDEVKNPVVCLGSIKKSKQLEAIMLANILSQLKHSGQKYELNYFNLFNPKLKRVIDYAGNFARNNGIQIFDENDALERFEEIYSLLKDRKANRAEIYPIFLFVSSAERLKELSKVQQDVDIEDEFSFSNSFDDDFGSSSVDYKMLINEGYKFSIFFIPQFETYKTCSELFNLNSYSELNLKFIVYDKDELSSEICRSNIKMNFNDNTAVLVNDGAISKICLYKKEV